MLSSVVQRECLLVCLLTAFELSKVLPLWMQYLGNCEKPFYQTEVVLPVTRNQEYCVPYHSVADPCWSTETRFAYCNMHLQPTLKENGLSSRFKMVLVNRSSYTAALFFAKPPLLLINVASLHSLSSTIAVRCCYGRLNCCAGLELLPFSSQCVSEEEQTRRM